MKSVQATSNCAVLLFRANTCRSRTCFMVGSCGRAKFGQTLGRTPSPFAPSRCCFMGIGGVDREALGGRLSFRPGRVPRDRGVESA